MTLTSYIYVMETKTQPSETAQGAAPEITQSLVKQYLITDLSKAIACLNAIQSDPDLLDNLAHFMHGRFINAKHAEENAKQKA